MKPATIYFDTCVWSSLARSDPNWAPVLGRIEHVVRDGHARVPISLPMVLELALSQRDDGSNLEVGQAQLDLMTRLSGGLVFRNLSRPTRGPNVVGEAEFYASWLSYEVETLFWTDESAAAVLDTIAQVPSYRAALEGTAASRLYVALALVFGATQKQCAIRESFERRLDALEMRLRGDDAEDTYEETRLAPPNRRLRSVLDVTLGDFATRSRSFLAKRHSGAGTDLEHRLYAVNCDAAVLDWDSARLLVAAGAPGQSTFDTTPGGVERFAQYLDGLKEG